MNRRTDTPPDHGRALGWLLILLSAVIVYDAIYEALR